MDCKIYKLLVNLNLIYCIDNFILIITKNCEVYYLLNQLQIETPNKK